VTVDRWVDRHVEAQEDDDDEVSEHAGDAAQGRGRRLEESGGIWEEAAHHGADPALTARFCGGLRDRGPRTLRCPLRLPSLAGRLRPALRGEAPCAGLASGAPYLASERA
jgi:hypothetical protein